MKYEINTVRLFCGFTIMLLSIVYCIITANVFGTPNEIETEAEAIVGGIATLIACIGFSTIGMSFRLNPSRQHRRECGVGLHGVVGSMNQEK